MAEIHASSVKSLLHLANHFDVVHHIPGRIRIRFLPSAIKAIRESDVTNLTESLPGLLNVRVNLVVGSVVIEYDGRMLPYELWENIGKLRKRPDLASDIAAKIEGHLKAL